MKENLNYRPYRLPLSYDRELRSLNAYEMWVMDLLQDANATHLGPADIRYAIYWAKEYLQWHRDDLAKAQILNNENEIAHEEDQIRRLEEILDALEALPTDGTVILMLGN